MMELYFVMIAISIIGLVIIWLAKKFHLSDFLTEKFGLTEEEERIMWRAKRGLLDKNVKVRLNRDTHKLECYNTKTGKTVKV